jgi:hypothetical protein
VPDRKERKRMRDHHNGAAVTMTAAVREGSGRDEAYAALHDKYLRLQADLANIRRRTAADGQQARADGRRDVLDAVLPALDAFERCRAMPARDGAFRDGMAARRPASRGAGGGGCVRRGRLVADRVDLRAGRRGEGRVEREGDAMAQAKLQPTMRATSVEELRLALRDVEWAERLVTAAGDTAIGFHVGNAKERLLRGLQLFEEEATVRTTTAAVEDSPEPAPSGAAAPAAA